MSIEQQPQPLQQQEVDYQKGLSLKQVEQQQLFYGKNVITNKKQIGLFIKFLKYLLEPLMLLLVLAGFMALGIAIYKLSRYTPGESDDLIEIIVSFIEPFVIWFIVILNAVFGLLQENKAEKSINALKKMTSPTARVLRDGVVMEIASEALTVNDILIINTGDQITGDGILLKSEHLEVDESLLTGESSPVVKDAQVSIAEDAPLAERINYVFSGTNVIHGRAEVLITAIGMKTEIGKISSLIDNEVDHLTPLQKKVNRLGKMIGIGSGLLCFAIFIIYLLVVGNIIQKPTNFGIYWHSALLIAVTLAIGTVPEGLVPIMTVILSMGIKRLSKKNALVKRISSAETLGSVSIICSDKTGTLTKNQMTVTKIWNVSTSNFSPDLTSPVNKQLLQAVALCNDAESSILEGKLNLVGDPTETSLLAAAYNFDSGFFKTNLNKKFPRLASVPFDSERKMMSVIVKVDEKFWLITKGAPDHMFDLLQDQSKVATYQNVNNVMSQQALRVLAVSIKVLDQMPNSLDPAILERDLVLVGLVGIIDPPRDEVKVAISETKAAGIRTVMITGDHANTAAAIAKELGILEIGHKVITSKELSQISDEKLYQDIEQYSVYARVSPADKIRIVKAWQARDKIVSMTGDGINDAPALKASDIGCAMGLVGTDVAKQAADLILTDDNFSTIVNAVKEGRELLDNIKRLMIFLLTSNLASMITTFLGIIFFAINPLSALQILWINVISETLPGIALGMNRSKAQLMQQKPLGKKAPILDRKMIFKILSMGFCVALISLFMYFVGVASFYDFNFQTTISALYNKGDDLISQELLSNARRFASSLAFLTLAFCLTTNSLIVRSQWSIFSAKWKDIKLLVYSLIASIIVIVFAVFVPGVNLVFNMNPFLGNNLILLIVPSGIAIVLFLTIEISKLIRHNWRKKSLII